MFHFDVKNYQTDLGENTTIGKNIQIDENLNCFVIIDSSNKKIVTPLLNKIVDYLLDTINIKDTYNTLSVSLESINFFIKTLKDKENNLENLNIIIGLLEKSNLHFAKIGKGSCFLVNQKKEVMEISDKNDKATTFDYISSGKITYGEMVIFASQSLGEYLTNSDWQDISKLDDISKVNDNIVNILQDEKVQSNISIAGILSDYVATGKSVNHNLEKAKNIFYKALDNNFSKKFIAFSMIIKDKIEARGKIVKNIIFFSGIIISTFILFSIISGILGKSIENSKTTEYKNNLIQAREYIRLANQNLANKEVFELNISKAEELVAKVGTEQLFLNDVQNIYDDISIIKKQFNGIEVFEGNTSNLIFKGNFDDGIKLIEVNKKLYVIGKSSIYGPIISGQDIKNNIFTELEVDDEFLDGVSVGDDIILTTKKQRVVKFTKDSKFNYINVVGQTTWQGSPFIETYNNNIYMTNSSQNQVFRHSPSSGSYTSGVPYLNDEDSKNLTKIVSVGIDGGIYMLKDDGKLFKFFSSPKYRLESIVLNKLPQNYSVANTNVKLIVRNNLNYIYMFLNDKVWIFEPNTKVFTDTKSLTYRGQIEGKVENILGFYVPRDGELNVLTKSGIYKINFEIKEEKLIIR
ncbi:MAG: hypothetical protein AB7E37_04225 [Candidatus Altimarinota bacterium]